VTSAAQGPGSSRRGATLMELLVALVILGIIGGGALGLLLSQSRSYDVGAARSETVQNLRFALLRLEEDLVTAGTHVPRGQPSLVYAGENVLAFHADYATNLPDDPFAVFFTPEAPTGQVESPTSPVPIPNSGVSHPSVTYEASPGVNSPAELLIVYLVPDDASPRDDDFALFRQVNDGEPELVARNLRRIDDEPFFRYLRIREEAGVGLVLDSIPDGDLPLFHSVPVHNSPADTGAVARIDSIRAVRVTVASSEIARGEDTPEVRITRVIRFSNVGRMTPVICGEPPLLGTALAAALEIDGETGAPSVVLTWDPAIDETGGQEDVLRYVIWRREAGEPLWGDPLRSIPSGEPSYEIRDSKVASGVTYQYALAAQDCTPSLSQRAFSNDVTIP
jgi:prepilin-type N-terminal cleavage/methylation domain-containing protein